MPVRAFEINKLKLVCGVRVKGLGFRFQYIKVMQEYQR